MIERANRTLRRFFQRLRSEKKKRALGFVLSEATYAKNICKSSKLTSSFQLLHGQHPRVMTNCDIFKLPTVSASNHVKNMTRKRLDKLMESKPRKRPDIKIGEYVLFLREKSRCLGPARVVEAGDKVIEFLFDEKTMTSSYNRAQKTNPPVVSANDSEEEDVHQFQIFYLKKKKAYQSLQNPSRSLSPEQTLL